MPSKLIALMLLVASLSACLAVSDAAICTATAIQRTKLAATLAKTQGNDAAVIDGANLLLMLEAGCGE